MSMSYVSFAVAFCVAVVVFVVSPQTNCIHSFFFFYSMRFMSVDKTKRANFRLNKHTVDNFSLFVILCVGAFFSLSS